MFDYYEYLGYGNAEVPVDNLLQFERLDYRKGDGLHPSVVDMSFEVDDGGLHHVVVYHIEHDVESDSVWVDVYLDGNTPSDRRDETVGKLIPTANAMMVDASSSIVTAIEERGLPPMRWDVQQD